MAVVREGRGDGEELDALLLTGQVLVRVRHTIPIQIPKLNIW